MQTNHPFDYLLPFALKYGNLYFTKDISAFIGNVTPEQLSDLRQAYEMAAKKQDAFTMSRWIDDCSENRAHISKKEYDFSRQVGQLLLLFDHLSRHGIPPFSSGAVHYEAVYKKPNWDTIPEELDFLIEVAEEYGVHSSESDMLEFLEHALPADMEKLARTAERMRLQGHWSVLNQWFDKFPFDKHPESWMVYSLIGLMDHAGLNFEPLG